MEIFVVVENFESLFLEVLVAKPNRRDKARGLAVAVSLPQCETALEECLREAFVDACKFGFVVRNEERELACNATV